MKTCYSCGAMLNIEKVPSYDRATHRPGKHCPVCHAPLDDTAIDHATIDHGDKGDHEKIRATFRAHVENMNAETVEG